MSLTLHYQTISPPMRQLLHELMELPTLQEFHLVGGTALALMLGHRHSVDIDLFNVNSFETKAIEAELQAHFPSYEGLYSSSYGLSCQINAIKTDIYCWNEPLLNPITEIDGLRLISDDDIFAMKLEAILTRREKRLHRHRRTTQNPNTRLGYQLPPKEIQEKRYQFDDECLSLYGRSRRFIYAYNVQ